MTTTTRFAISMDENCMIRNRCGLIESFVISLGGYITCPRRCSFRFSTGSGVKGKNCRRLMFRRVAPCRRVTLVQTGEIDEPMILTLVKDENARRGS